MSYLVAAPEFLASAANDLSNIGSALTATEAATTARTTGIAVAAEDEVSAAIAELFSEHGKAFQALGAQAAAFHAQFVQTLDAAGGAYAAAEAANSSLLGTLEQDVLGAITAPVQALTARILGSPPTPIPAKLGAIFTGTPSLPTQIENASLFGIKNVFGLLPPGLATQLGQKVIGPLLSLEFTNTPPKILTLLLGETVQHTTFDGIPVLQITPADPTGHYVVALYGGGFTLPPTIFHWLDYTLMAHQTGATIEVPLYPLAQQGGTAGTVVPEIAGLISMQIAQHGAPNVSVTGDSSGGNLALAAVEYMVANNQTVPASMVLVSPWLDLSQTNPNAALVNDPLANSPLENFASPGSSVVGSLQNLETEWAGNLPENNPLVSPLYGSLQGLPPTDVYAGSLDSLTPDAVVLQQEAATQGAPISFVFANGGFHDWVYLTPDGFELLPQIYQELGIA